MSFFIEENERIENYDDVSFVKEGEKGAALQELEDYTPIRGHYCSLFTRVGESYTKRTRAE